MTDAGKFGKILVAFDGSSYSAKAVEVASALTKTDGTELIIVHVYSAPAIVYTGAGGIPVPNYPELEDTMREGAQKTLSRGVELARESGAKARGELLEAASTVQAITEFAAGEKVGLIVAGTRGMGTFKKLVLGSVSAGFVSHASCSVLVVR
jgi:nucleotide-binding universal stress UspA family protein